MGRKRRVVQPLESLSSSPGRAPRAVGYARVSTNGQASDGFSLADQRRRIQAHAAAAGYELVTVYEDAGVSGKTTDRPALAALLEAAERGGCDVVIVVKLDRLTRSLRDLLTLSERLEQFGVALVSLKESIDTSTPVGRLFRNVLGALAEFERETIIDRVTSGQRQKAAEGRRVGARVPHGYSLAADGATVISEPQAGIVRRIFGERADGATFQRIADGLNADGILAPRGGRWYPGNVAAIVDNPYYAGKVRWGTRSARGVILTDATDHEPIVSVELFTVRAAAVA